jgi:hypothetical protein
MGERHVYGLKVFMDYQRTLDSISVQTLKGRKKKKKNNGIYESESRCAS